MVKAIKQGKDDVKAGRVKDLHPILNEEQVEALAWLFRYLISAYSFFILAK